MKNNSLNRDFNVRNISFKSNLFISYIAQCSTIGSKFLQVTLINLNFGLETFGEFTLLVSINNIITTLLSFGSADAISIFFKEESLKRENSNPLLVIFLNFLITSISNLMLLIIIYFLLPFLNKTIGNDSTLAIFFYSIVSVINNYRSITHGYMNANMMYKKINFINSLDVIIKTLFIFFFILLVKDYSLLNIVKPVVLGGMLVFIIEIIFAINHFKKNQTSKLRINNKLINKYLKFQSQRFISSTLKIGKSNLQLIILSFYFNNTILGLFETLNKFFLIIPLLSQPFSMLTLARLKTLFDQGKFKQFKLLIYKITFGLIIVFMPISLILFSLSNFYLSLQKINVNTFDSNIFILLILLLLSNFLNTLLWWTKNFILIYKPIIGIYTNTLSLLSILLLSTLIFELSPFSDLTNIGISYILSTIPGFVLMYYYLFKSNLTDISKI